MIPRTGNDTPYPPKNALQSIDLVYYTNEQMKRFCLLITTLACLLLCALGLSLMMLLGNIYNNIAGPFHLNQTQFVTQLQTYNQNLSPSSLLRWVLLRKEYLQIEIGENLLERNPLNLKRNIQKTLNTMELMLVATMHQVEEPTIARSVLPDRLFITLPSVTNSYSRDRHSYDFEAFTIDALGCALRHLGVRPSDFITGTDKMIYARAIERRYKKNATYFNMVVAPTCGMLTGYLYRARVDSVYLPNSTSEYVFRSRDIAFEASKAYYSPVEIAFFCIVLVFGIVFVFFGIVFGLFLLESLFYCITCVNCSSASSRFVLPPDVQAQLKALDIESLQTLDALLSAVSEQQHFHHRLFIIQEHHLIVLHVDWNDHNPQRLRQFYDGSLFTVYAVASINKVFPDGFCVRDSKKETWIPFSIAVHDTDDSQSAWLHDQLMSLSERYRQR